jgi:L-threonylcarbamoyladenylate synthase
MKSEVVSVPGKRTATSFRLLASRMQKIETKIIRFSADERNPYAIEIAADTLRRGGLVAFPTETVYGLAADATNAAAVRKVFQAKGRPTDNPLIIHIADPSQLDELSHKVSPRGMELAARFWPGPLTLVVERSDRVPKIVAGGLDTVGVRMPNHSIPLRLIRALERAIVGPSANTSGRPSPTTAQHVYTDLNGKIELILDAGPTAIGVESTVIDVTCDPPVILRVGGLTRETIEAAIGRVNVSGSEKQLRRSPGTQYRHYAPEARVALIKNGDVEQFERELAEWRRRTKKIGCIVHTPNLARLGESARVLVLPPEPEGFSRHLFSALRQLDEEGIEVILVETVPEEGLGEAIMDRLRRAAAQ